MITQRIDPIITGDVFDVISDKVQVYDLTLALLVDHIFNHIAALTALTVGISTVERPAFEAFFDWPTDDEPTPELLERTKRGIADDLEGLIALLRKADSLGAGLTSAYQALDIPHLDFAVGRGSRSAALAREAAPEPHTPQGW